MNLLAKPEVATDFPYQDLSAPNAQLLELMLANKEIIVRGHIMADKTSWTHRVGYPALKVAIQAVFTDANQVKAFDHGVRTYHAIEWLTQSIRERCDEQAVREHTHNLVSAFDPDEVTDYIGAAHQHFASELPRTAHVVAESSRRFYPALAQYAVYGASAAYQFELDTLES